jgi:acetyltransferase-like isoleucine patch superfamily enzyme
MIQTSADGRFFGGRVTILRKAILSDGVILATYGGSIDIQESAYIGPYCVIYGHGGVVIGPNTMIGAHTVVVAANHGFAQIDKPMNKQPLTTEGIAIAEDVWIGSGSMILDGTRIGKGAVIGAGSVVTGNIDAYTLAVGAPAKAIRNRKKAIESRANDQG